MTAAGALGVLLEMVERCEPEGDRELDEALCDAFGKRTSSGLPSFNGGLGIPAFTRSLDDAVALVERRLPGWKWVIHNPRSGLSYGASVADPSRGGIVAVAEKGVPSAPLALVAALLKALIAQAPHPSR